MKKILMVESSPMAESSFTRKITNKIETRLRAKYPQAEILHRDLTEAPLPHLDKPTISAFRSKESQRESELSDNLVAEFLAADLIVIAYPMWNFSIPSSLKAWVDHVLRAGKTFEYSEKGPRGLAAGRKAVVVSSAGGVYSEGPMKAADFASPYLQFILNFIGINDIQTVRVEGVGIPTKAAEALSQAESAVERLVI